MRASSRGRWLLVAGGLLGGLAACNTSSTTAGPTPTPPPTTLAPATLADLSASTASAQSGQQINCRADVIAQVTLANHSAGGGVSVSGVRKTTQGLAGGCSVGSSSFTYTTAPIGVGPGETVVVMNRSLYSGGSGCCAAASSCDGSSTCGIQESFTVVTTVGEVAAGSFSYQVNFQNCAMCSATMAAAGMRCLPPSH
ncbi:MAG TPA: hypothetical protein VN375_15140 [Vicinamibacteria bacterium]|nr:hypothetical protein [Vicinamibacteria bacterium]